LVKAPVDLQYNYPFQPKKPLIEQQMHSEDDLRNVYNPNKEKNFWPASTEDIRHMGRYGRNGLY